LLDPAAPEGHGRDRPLDPFYDAPKEGHVFTSLSNRLKFHLGTERGIWAITGNRIRLFEKPLADAGR